MLKYIIKSKISITLLLIIFILVSFGIFVVGNKVLALDCAEDKNGNPVCSGGSFRLQVGIPGLTNSCEYTSVSYLDGKRIETPKTTLYCVSGFPEYIKAIYDMFIGIVGIFAVIMIMLGGFQWLLAAGNAQRISGAKTTIMSAVLGLVLALTSYTILSIVNPEVIDLNLYVSPAKLEAGPAVGLCTKKLDPILKGDAADGPQCGKKYVIAELGDKGQDVYCAGFVMDEVAACVTIDGSNYNPHKSLSIKDESGMGFGAKTYGARRCLSFLGLLPCSSGLIFDCGEIYYTHDRVLQLGSLSVVPFMEYIIGSEYIDTYIYNFGVYCEEDKHCVIDAQKAVAEFTISSDSIDIVDKDYSLVGRINGAKCAPNEWAD